MQSRELQEIRKEKHHDVNMNYIAEQSKFNLTSQNNFISFKINSTSLCKQIYNISRSALCQTVGQLLKK